MGRTSNVLEPISLFLVYVFVSKKNGNCPIFFKKLYYV